MYYISIWCVIPPYTEHTIFGVLCIPSHNGIGSYEWHRRKTFIGTKVCGKNCKITITFVETGPCLLKL